MDEDLEKTTYHEAGHCVMAVLRGAKVERATIAPEEDGFYGFSCSNKRSRNSIVPCPPNRGARLLQRSATCWQLMLKLNMKRSLTKFTIGLSDDRSVTRQQNGKVLIDLSNWLL